MVHFQTVQGQVGGFLGDGAVAHDLGKVPDSAEEAVAHALEFAEGPIIINESSDNPGGGTPGDGTHLLRELLKRQDRYDSLIRGKIIWCWADYRHYRGFVMDGLGLQAVYGPWGLVTIDRKPKPKLIAALKEHFAEKGEG